MKEIKITIASCIVFFFSALFPIAHATEAWNDPYIPDKVIFGHIISSFSELCTEKMKVAAKILFETRFREKYPDCEARTVMFNDLESAIEAIHTNEIDGLVMTTLDFIRTRNTNGLIPIRNVSMGQTATASFVLVAHKNKFQSVADLKGGSIILDKGSHGEAAQMWIDTVLLSQSLSRSEGFFSSIETTEKPSQSVLKVFFGNADACIVTQQSFNIMQELNPQVGTRLSIIEESPRLYIGIFGINKNLDERKRAFIEKAIDTLSNDAEGKHLLLLLRVEQVDEYKPEYLEAMENLFKTYNLLGSTGK